MHVINATNAMVLVILKKHNKYTTNGRDGIVFDPVAYGSKLLTRESEGVKAFVEHQVDKSIVAARTGTALQVGKGFKLTYDGTQCYYTDNGRLTREEAIARESDRLIEMWNQQWSHHLNEADVKALVDGGRLMDFTVTPVHVAVDKGLNLEESIRTYAYYLWIEAGRPESDGKEFWETATDHHNRYWLPYQNGYVPSPQEVNDWNCVGMGHDSINCSICVNARCEREGIDLYCPECKGNGSVWESEEDKQKAESWESSEPPVGEGYQCWETVSEGSPISPVFKTPEELATYLVDNPWGGATSDCKFEDWMKFIVGDGWAPSMIVENGVFKSGVKGIVDNE